MTAVVAGCAERARIADPARTWHVRIADGLATVGDEELLRRAVDNLLMNVLVHTPAGTAGAISAYETGGQVIIDVSDDGPGVPPDQLPHIFERFYRAGARSRLYVPGQPAPAYLPAGSGLGLAIAAEIASAHGGTASAAPDRQKGLRITLSLPVDGRPDTDSEPRDADSDPRDADRKLMAHAFSPRWPALRLGTHARGRPAPWRPGCRSGRAASRSTRR
jgi:two-component system OmpR family sensor kinase